jgi:hypothetical protein
MIANVRRRETSRARSAGWVAVSIVCPRKMRAGAANKSRRVEPAAHEL